MDVTSCSVGEALPPCQDPPRLMITKIVCENFKSYAGVKMLGPFHKCFSSIVGPNGSGKSNVIDAMLFVFGYRARKIRSKKVSVLVHSSEHHAHLTHCSVSVHFHNIVDLPGADAYEVVPGSNFVVSRTAFKDNSSFYQLDGRRTPFKQVAAHLRSSGIDLDHNRFLILQGEVEQIALMKPRAAAEHEDGMLEFLEDIIGTSRLKEPIEELSSRVEEADIARGEKLNRVKAAEREKDALEEAKKEAEGYLARRREVACKQHLLYQRYIYECRGHEAAAAERKEELAGELAQLQQTQHQHAAAKKEKRRLQKKEMRAYEALVDRSDACKEAMAACEQRDVKARQDMKNCQGSLKKARKGLVREKERLTQLESAPEEHARCIRESESKLKILKARRKEHEEELAKVMESLKTATQSLQKEKEERELRLVALSHAANKAKSKLEVGRAELELYRERAEGGDKQLAAARARLLEAGQARRHKADDHASLQASLPEQRQALSATLAELREVEGEVEGLSRELHGARSRVEEARSSLQAHRSQGQVLEALLAQKTSGAIPGIHGRLGDLGAIPERYDVAISTACPALEHIVVDCMETGVRCVQFLKSSGIGVATFIALDKVERWRREAGERMDAPEGVPRLFDLVAVQDTRFLPAFYFALRNTLVTPDLDQATRIGLQGRKRYRVVTLQGQLIDSSGTMSGGGGRVVRGRMSSRLQVEVSPCEVSELERQLRAREDALASCSARRARLEGDVAGLKKTVQEGGVALRRLEREQQLLAEKESSLQAHVADLEQQTGRHQKDPALAADLKATEERLNAEHALALEAAEVVGSEVKQLHARIMEVGGARVEGRQAQLDAVTREIDATTATITKANVATKSAQRSCAKSRVKVASLEGEVAEMEARLTELKGVLTSLEDEARDIISQQEKLHVALQEREGELERLRVELEAASESERQQQTRSIDLTHEMEKYSAKMKENAAKARHFMSEVSRLEVGEEGGPQLSPEQLQALDKKATEYEITLMEETLKQMTPNMAAIAEYKEKEAAHCSRLKELEQVTAERDSARVQFDTLRKERLDSFMAGFTVITAKLKEMYQMITLGGDAELELVDSLDPFSEGVVFSVRPPKKSWKSISNLSGGEKTLSSLALVFALHHYKPSPLYVMDEIDAALDFKNVSIVASYIKERTKNAQFIIISLRNNMFELADRLIGIYKTDNCTKTVTIAPHQLPTSDTATRQEDSC